jgi:DeoR/GlpR family transcriptional regulator of sugar metabolism
MKNNDNLLKVQRQAQIRSLVEENGQVTVTELSPLLNVSEATIRRDLEECSSRGWMRRTHGGAVKIERAGKEPPILERVTRNANAKERIGKKAAEMIQDGETIFLGSGTTVLEIAKHLSYDIYLTVITNSLLLIDELVNRPNIDIIVIGGMLRRSELSMVGHIANQAVQEFRADRVFMGIRAVDPTHGFTNDYLPEAVVDREILKIAPEIIFVLDHEKFAKVSSVLVAPANAIDIIITDDEAPVDVVSAFRDLMIKVYLV